MPPGGFRPAGAAAAARPPAAAATPALPPLQQQATSSTWTGGPRTGSGATAGAGSAREKARGGAEKGEMPRSVAGRVAQVGGGETSGGALSKASPRVTILAGCGIPAPFTPFTPFTPTSTASVARPRSPLVALPPPSNVQVPVASSSSAQTSTSRSANLPAAPPAPSPPTVTSSHFSAAKTRPSVSTSTPRPPPPVQVIPVKRPSPADKGKGKAPVEQEDDEEIDENLNPHLKARASPKRARTSLDSGYTEGDPVKTEEGENKENDPGDLPRGGAEVEPEIPESENGEEGELLEVAARSSATGGDVGMAGPGVEETRSGIGDDGMGDHVDADLVQIEEDLLAFTNRRVAIMQGFVDIAERGGGRSKDGQDANELRHTQSYVEERYQEARGRLEALGIPFTELQIQTEKRASCLEELAEVVWSPGSYSSNGNDEGLLRHTLSYIDTRIAQLKASPSSTHSRPTSRPPLPRIASILPGSTSHHASPSAVPGSVVRPSAMPVLLPFGGSGAGGATPAAQKASSTTSGTGSQTSATVAALAAQQQRMSGRIGTGMGGGTPAAARNGPAKVNATNSSESEQITLSSSSDHDPIRPPIKRPAPLQPAKRPATAAAPTSTSGFRAAGTGAQQPAARTEPPTVHTSVSSDKGKGRVEHPLPEVDALLDGVDFDGMDFEEFDGSPLPQQQQQHQRHPNQPASTTRRNNNESANNAAFMITLDDPPPPRNYQANPAHQSLPEQRRLPPGVQPSANRNISIASTVSTASDLVITSGADSASTSKAAASTSTAASKAVVSAPKKTYPWTRDVYKALRQRFGLKSFRVNQEDAINATLSGRDVFVLLPTGGGKSLCFQLPAVVSSGKTRGVTIVVSPLLSLISDQTKGLMEKDIPVVFLNSTMPAADKQFALSCLRADPPMACLAYVTPEQIVKSGQFRDLLSDLHRRNQLARFVLDEAHCISSWGHDFRPDYKQMGTLKRDYPDVPLIALTATANDRVKTDVMTNLAMDRPLVLTQSFNRANLRYHVRKKGKTILADIAEFIKKDHQGECGIIYCSSKKQCEDVADKLRREYSIKSMHYHAGMDKDDRIRVQENWQAGRVHVICATIAFGMGIDKPDVRFVIHHSLSQSLEAYYQETGRAGRDGMSSVCVLYFAYGDTKLLMRLIDEGEGTPEQKEHNRANLRRVVQYCMNETDCRRTQVLQYFGEQFPRDMCHKTCDNCMAPKNVEMRDVTDLAQNAMRLVKSIQKDKGVTMLYAIDVFRGLKYQKISAAGHDRLAEAGKGSGIDRGDAERLFQLLASEQILGERYERNGLGFTNAYVTLGPRAHQFLNGRITLQMGFAGKEKTGKGKGKGTVAAKAVNESYEHDDYEGEYVDELYDEQTGIYDEDPDGEWDPWGRRVVRTHSMNALQDADGSGVQVSKQASSSKKAGNGGDTSTLLAQLMDLRERTAADQGCDASAVISDKALQLIAARRPQSVSDFLAIAGLTPKDCDWWTDHGGKALCVKFGAVSDTSGSSKGSTLAAASKSRSTKSTASNARTPVAAAAAAASAAEARSAAAARRPPASRAKAPAKTVGKQFDLAAFRYKPGGSGASGSAGGGGGGIMAMPVMRKK
ncbi:hypothetical protein JCM5296_000304 [Sporobolomyces johnsonii]